MLPGCKYPRPRESSSLRSSRYLITRDFFVFVCAAAPVRTNVAAGVPGSLNSGPGYDAADVSSADGGMTLCSGRIWILVDGREDIAASNIDELWKQVTTFPPNPKLTTGIRAAARPRGSFVPNNEGEGAYGAAVGGTNTTWEGGARGAAAT